MRYLHNIKISVFLKPEQYLHKEEIFGDIDSAFHKLMPVDFEKEKLQILEETVEGFENRKIKIISLEILKEAHTNVFLKNLIELLGQKQYEQVLNQKESRLDEELCFYIRLDLAKLLLEEVKVTESGECFHIKMQIAAFPKNRTAALATIEKMLGEQKN